MTNASARARLDDLEAKKEDIEIAIAREKIAKTPLSKEKVVFWISKFKGGDIDDPAYRQSLVDIFINSVFLYDDRLVIGFNWKDDSKTVTQAELESAGTAQNWDSSGSYLDDNRPAHCGKSEFYRSRFTPVGGGFGFVRFMGVFGQ